MAYYGGHQVKFVNKRANQKYLYGTLTANNIEYWHNVMDTKLKNFEHYISEQGKFEQATSFL